MQLSIVIVNYKVSNLVLQCVDAALKAAKGIDAEVFVVDNNSGDDIKKKIETYFPTQVKLILSPENGGFAKANNMALRQAKGDYVLLLNPDTIIGEDCLKNTLQFAKTADSFGALGVKMINMKGEFLKESKRELPTMLASCVHLFNFSCLKKHYPYYVKETITEEIMPAPILSGAFMLMNKKALGDTVLLDEDFFMYGEDIDLSYRILKKGYQNYYFPQTIIHYKGESSVKDVKNRTHFFTAMAIYCKKHRSKPAYWLVKCCIACIILLLKLKKSSSKKELDNKEEKMVSTADFSYKELIQLVEKEGGKFAFRFHHPNFNITV